jgi:hypothetical protein
MGSIIRFARPRPLIRLPKKLPAERESAEARRALFILIGSFFGAALVMCAAVVAMVSSTWTDVVVMSAFVLVFALLKIVLANALIYAMLRYDAADQTALAEARTVPGYRRPAPVRQAPEPIRQAPEPKSRQTSAAKTGTLRLATGSSQPGAPRAS